MRGFAVELRRSLSAIARAIDIEGVLLIGGIGGLAWLTWDITVLDIAVPLGPVIIFVSMIVAGTVFARAPRSD